MGRLKTKRGVKQRHDRKLKTTLTVGRTQGETRGPAAFTSCAKIGATGYFTRPPRQGVRTTGETLYQPFPYACATGKNPRVAVSNALKYLAEKVKSRHGAFRGRK
jgi:hypothetical protein